MKKKFFAFLNFLFALLFAIFIGFVVADAFLFALCHFASKNIEQNELYKVMRFKVYGSGKDTISGRFWFYDKNGKEIAVIERSWNGFELYLDFASSKFGEIETLFPTRLYTDSIYTAGTKPFLSQGTSLARYYLDDECCALYTSAGDDDDLRKSFLRLSTFALADWSFFGGKQRKNYTVRLTQYKAGVEYAIFLNTSGTFAILQD